MILVAHCKHGEHMAHIHVYVPDKHKEQLDRLAALDRLRGSSLSKETLAHWLARAEQEKSALQGIDRIMKKEKMK